MVYANPKVFGILVLGIALILGTPAVAEEGWGTIEGTITLRGGDVPKEKTDQFVVNARNRGLKNVFVWLIDARNPERPKAPPLNPKVKLPREVRLTIQAGPPFRYEPRALALEQKQLVAIKNDTRVNQRVVTLGYEEDNPRIVTPVLAGTTIRITLSASRAVVAIAPVDDMKIYAYARVFDHPYFAVSDLDGQYMIKDAPAGKYNLVMWHEGVGWINGGKLGKCIEIRPGKKTEVNQEVKPAKEDWE